MHKRCWPDNQESKEKRIEVDVAFAVLPKWLGFRASIHIFIHRNQRYVVESLTVDASIIFLMFRIFLLTGVFFLT